MKIENFDGIILSETNYSESSKILNVYTKEHGLIGIMSKGCRNIKSKLRGVSRKLIYGNFNVYYRDNGLCTLISIDLISSFSNCLNSLEKISYASFVLDLALQVLRQSDEDFFDLLKDVLLKINDDFNPLIITNMFELKMLDYLGVRPSIDCCSFCGSNKSIVTLSSSSGGFVCKNCYTNQGYVSENTIKMIRLYYYVDIKNITKLDVDEQTIKEINSFLDDYYDRYTGLYLKSKSFIKNLNKL